MGVQACLLGLRACRTAPDFSLACSFCRLTTEGILKAKICDYPHFTTEQLRLRVEASQGQGAELGLVLLQRLAGSASSTKKGG